MVPPIALGRPENFLRGVDEAKECLARIYIWIGLLPHQNFLLAGCRIHNAQLFCFVSPLVVVVIETLAVREPLEARPILERKLQRRRLHIDALARLKIEDNRLRLGQHFARQGIDIGESPRPNLVWRDELQAGEVS